MIIRTAGNSYRMIGYLEQRAERELCLCENMENHSRCLLVRIMDPKQIRDSVGFLYEQAGKQAFTDFEECTVDGEDLLAVFTYPLGQTLEEKLSREYTGMAERLDIVKHILEKLILQDMGPYFAALCLRPGGVWVTRSGDISFLYDTVDAGKGNGFGMKEVSAALCSLLEYVFSGELKKETVPELETFLWELDEDSFADYVKLYGRFLEVQDHLLRLSQETLAMPKTWIFRVWDKVKRMFGPLKKLAALVLLMIALVYMAWTVRTASLPAASMDLLERIGTLDIPQ